MFRKALLSALAVALLFAGVASAAALRTIRLSPGHCTKVHGTKVCAKKVKPKVVTVYPTALGKSYSGTGSVTLAPVDIPARGVTAHWTSQAGADGYNSFTVFAGSDMFDNGNSATSGSSYIEPGSGVVIKIVADGPWTLTF